MKSHWKDLTEEQPEELMIQNPDGLLIPQTKEERDLLERHLSHLDKSNVKQLLQEFFDILDTVEVSDSGREFNPVCISSCRVELTQRVSDVMKGLKEYADEV
jgi:hypothetical protein